ncbi:MAG TPA: S24 family peptidase [Thermoflexus sp.]|nr:S24 family peptidase [Thermoflexus sp.]
MDEDLHLLSQLIWALNEPAHPGLERLGDLLNQSPPDRVGLRRLCRLLLSTSAEDLARPEEGFRCHAGAQIVAMALDRWEGWLSLPTAQRQLADLCRSLRLHGLALPEALAALLGAQWLRSHDPAWALEMARRAERLLGELHRAAVLQGRPHAELFDGIQHARRLIREILDHTSDSEAASRAEETPEPPPDSEASSPAPTPPEAVIPAPGWPLRPARLFLISFTLLPDAHPHAGDLQFLDPQTVQRFFDQMEVLIDSLEVGGRIYRPYVEADMETIVPIRLSEVLVLRVEGDSMRGVGIESGDLILAQRVPGHQARDPSFWTSLIGRLVLAVLLERYQDQAHQAFLIKRLTRRNGRWWLDSENPRFESIPLDPGTHEMHPVLAILKPVEG